MGRRSLLRAGVLPVPRLGAAAAALGPVGQEPAVVAGVRDEPGVLSGAERLDAAGQVDRKAPAVLAVPGSRGETRLDAAELPLLGKRAVPVGHADRLAQILLVGG